MYNPPKLSIISVNLNNASGLRKTMESVVDQTFNDFEYLIIDGGSIDGSVEIIGQFTNKITYWVSEPDKGIYNAMNKGILQAKGEYCLFLNSGDYLPAINILESIIPELSKGSDILYCNGFFQNKFFRKKVNLTSKLTKDYFFYSSIIHPSSFIKRIVLIQMGMYDESFKYCADYNFFLKCYTNYINFKHINIYSSVFVLGGFSTNKDFQEKIKLENSKIRNSYFSKEDILIKLNIIESELEDFRSNFLISLINRICKRLNK